MTDTIQAGSFKPPPWWVAVSKPGGTWPNVVGYSESYLGWLSIIRERIKTLDITQETLEHVAGLQSGYAAKIVSGQRRAGPFVMFTLQDALGLDMLLVDNPEKRAVLNGRLVKRRVKRAALSDRHYHMLVFGPDQVRLNGSKGGRNRALKLSKERKRIIAKRAARVRWADRAAGTSAAAKPRARKRPRRPRNSGPYAASRQALPQ